MEDTPHSERQTPLRRKDRHQKELNTSRRAFLKKAAGAAIGVGLLGGYAGWWEPRHLEINRLNLSLSGLPAAFAGMKIVHFSDVHLGYHTDAEDFKRLAALIQAEQPDVLCFTGDIVDDHPYSMLESIDSMAGLNAPLGKFAVLGNHDYKWVSRPDGLPGLYPRTGFQLLRNEHVWIQKGKDAIAMIGLEDQIEGKVKLAQAVDGIPSEAFRILLMHEPDYADTAAASGFALQLSGHSHGGQVRLPFVGALITPLGGRRYIQGLHYIGETHMPLYVNRGFGMTRLPIRFLCRPELTVLTLNPV
ncbi:metallophosphoesterase [Paenibacillus sp. JX-17]|uniref:Metallophosphoesterase n=1 Tax=Paenibacillus lacisoli TaxID=3064525 RepID=A0ABT9CHF4_9BACL|nr:metallophosphoesterase [Paenibacillus sp. JX-17]MDO7907033.1 metallophosphoesterase [Paenibacillus sp. JX-17]